MNANRTHALQSALIIANSTFSNPYRLGAKHYMPWGYAIHEGVLAGARSILLAPQWPLAYVTRTDDGREHKTILYSDFAAVLMTLGEDNLGHPVPVTRVVMLVEINKTASDALEYRDCHLDIARDRVIEQCQQAFSEDSQISRIVAVACTASWWSYRTIDRTELRSLSEYRDTAYISSNDDKLGLELGFATEWSPASDLCTPQGLQNLMELRPILEQIQATLHRRVGILATALWGFSQLWVVLRGWIRFKWN